MIHAIAENFMLIAGGLGALFILVLGGASIEDALKRP